MPISFVPAAGDVLYCDYGPDPLDTTIYPVYAPPLGMPPEMQKNRRVVVLNANRDGSLIMIAPFSHIAPKRIENYHHLIPFGRYPFFTTDSWLKGDMLMAASPARLDRVKFQGRYARAALNAVDLKEIRKCTLEALGLGRLKGYI